MPETLLAEQARWGPSALCWPDCSTQALLTDGGGDPGRGAGRGAASAEPRFTGALVRHVTQAVSLPPIPPTSVCMPALPAETGVSAKTQYRGPFHKLV